MEKQINIGGQNIKQIGQSPVTQSIQTPKKSKINPWKISTVLLLIILLIAGTCFILNTKNRTSSSQMQTTSNQANQIVVTGVIRTSGLSEDEKQKFGLITVNYQITNLKVGQIQGYYLPSNNVSGDLLGKCARVTGTIPEEWKNNNKAEAYNRSVLIDVKIEKLDYSSCSPYNESLDRIDLSVAEKVTLTGTVIHDNRPSPDIFYDYVFKLNDPFIDKNSSTGSPQKITSVVLVPGTNKHWQEIEDNLNKEIKVEGQMIWGYAESKYFGVLAINGDEETEVRNLVTRFETYVENKNIKDLMALFTPAKTKEEIASYRNLMGQDPDVGAPRLFNNVTSNFIVTNWKIAKRESPDNKEIISKNNSKYVVTVEETRKSWCNADPCVGTYSFENTSPYIFEIVSVNSQWMIDKYYFMNQRNVNGGPKYEALMF